uniref:Uncharacterized protein n=1 Tax=Peronospora matthiolae TaxID=2874970 RepID=A0AAV1TC10_9STRA
MEVHRAFIDNAFERYVLATGEELTKRATALSVPALAPLLADPGMRKKAHWEARVHHNALTLDPFLSQSYGATVAYFVGASYQLVQVLEHKTRGVKLKSVYDLPQLAARQENVSVQVAGKGFVVYCDGHGMLHCLRAETDQEGSKWSQVYECAPWGVVPLLLVGALYDAQHHHLRAVVAEPLFGNGDDRAFRLSVACVFLSTAATMKRDMAEHGLNHVTSTVAVVSKLPTLVSFSGPDVVLLVEGTYELLMKLVADKSERTVVNVAPVATGVGHVRCHEEDDLTNDEMTDLLSAFPRAGIGFHGAITKPKVPSELASVDFKTSLRDRFHKSSTPFSSVATSLNEAPLASTHPNKEGASRTSGHRCEVPTAESLLSGFEECDSGDPNAKACVLLVNCEQQVVQHQMGIDCMQFQFLCPSARVQDSSDYKSALLFRNDVHGLIFGLNGTEGPLALRHSATLPAFGFVQASKQEKKFMSCHASGSLACIGEFQRRVFVYQGKSSETERESHTRKQHMMEFGDQELLGMQVADENTVLVLTSSQVYSLQLCSSTSS